MGRVFRVFDRAFGLEVAAKVLEPGAALQVPHLQREFRAVSGLVHPNLVSLFELHPRHDRPDEPFYTMELVADAVPLERGPRPEHEVLNALCQVVTGLDALHQAGLVHNDLKPSNVLVCPRTRRVALADFGLVSLHGAKTWGATPRYTAPELWDTGVGDTATDRYALGVLLYEALTGRVAFGDSLEDVLAAKSLGLTLDPGGNVRPALRELVVALTSKPAHRPGLGEVARILGAQDTPRSRPLTRTAARIVGREAELQRLADTHGRCQGGARRLVLVTGAGGAGRSALLEVGLAGLRGPRLVARPGEHVPGRLHRDLVTSLCGVDAGHREVALALRRESAAAPLLVIDDLHLADSTSLLQLAASLAEVEGGLCVVATWLTNDGRTTRAANLDVPAPSAAASLEPFLLRAGLELQVVPLPPLTPDAALELGRSLGLDDAATRSAGGSPGFLALLAAGGLDGLVASLPPDALHLTRLLAAAAEPTPLPVLCRAFGVEDDTRFIAALGALRARRFVWMGPAEAGGPSASHTSVSLTHAPLGEVLLEGVGRAERRLLHLGLAEGWRAFDPAAALPIVTHLLECGDPDLTGEAVTLAEEAAARAKRAGRPRELALYMRLAVDRGRGDATTLIEALETSGSLVEAGERSLWLATTRAEQSSRWQIRALVDLMLGGALVEGRRVLEALRTALGPTLGRRPGLFRIALTTVWHHYIGGLTKRLEPQPGKTLSPTLSHTDELAILDALALGHAITDPMASAYYQVLHLRSALRQRDPERLVRALSIHLMHATASGVSASRLAVARAALVSWVQRADSAVARATAAVATAGAAWLSGRADEAFDEAERAQRFLDAVTGGLAWERGSLAVVRCALLEETGQWERLEAVSRELVSAARERGDVHVESQLRCRSVAMVALARGEVARAREELARGRALMGGEDAVKLEVFAFHALRVETAALIAERRGAEALAHVEAATSAMRRGVVLRTAYHRTLVDIARVEARLAAAAALPTHSGRDYERLVAEAQRLAKRASRRANPLHAARLDVLATARPGAPTMAPTPRDLAFPRAALDGRRQALGPEPTSLPVVFGDIPAGLRGSWYVIAADGDFSEARTLDRRAFLPFLNGDGFVARLALGPDGVSALRRPVETPCLVADREAARIGDPALAFQNFGITRASPRLGLRNQANTALQAVSFAGRTRLLATYDAGTPVEIDPLDLSFVRPIGHAAEWHGGLGRRQPFRTLTSTAHPAWDPREGALYLFEGGRPRSAFTDALRRLVGRRRPRLDELEALDRLDGLGPEEKLRAGGWLGPNAPFVESWPSASAEHLRDAAAAAHEPDDDTLEDWLLRQQEEVDAELAELATPTDTTLRELRRFSLEFAKAAIGSGLRLLMRRRELTQPGPGLAPPYGRLLVWRGEGGARMLDAFELRVSDGTDKGRPLHIVASAHQVIATRNCVVVFDTTFKFETDLALPIDEEYRRFAHTLRARISGPQPHSTRGYVISKRDLVAGQSVFARPFDLPAEVVHLTADYEDEGGAALVIHAVDNRATDPAEFLLADDRQGWDRSAFVPPEALSMMPCGLELNALTSYRIDVPVADEGAVAPGVPLAVTELGRVADPEVTWTIGLGASAELFGPRPQPERVTDSYWYTQGLDRRLVSDIVLDLYREHPRRETPLGEVERLARLGIQPRILHVRHAAPVGGRAGEFRLVDSFAMPAGMLACSVHVACDRWILCATFGRPTGGAPETGWGRDIAEREVWVFDKDALSKGPIARIDASALASPYTLHASWIDEDDLPTSPVPAAERFGTGPDEFGHVPLDDRYVRDFLGRAFAWSAQKR